MTSSSFRNRMNRAAQGGVLHALLMLGTSSYAALGCSDMGTSGQSVEPGAGTPTSPSVVGPTTGGSNVEATTPGNAPAATHATQGSAVEGTPDVALNPTNGAPGGSGEGSSGEGGEPADDGNPMDEGTPPAPPPGEPSPTGGVAPLVPFDPALLSRCTGTSPIVCRFDAPNGNYDVSVELGDATSAAVSRVAAETRRHVGPAVATAAGAFAVLDFTVNVRAEVHDGGQSAAANLLEITIDGDAPKLHGIGIRSAPNSPTLFVASDSTAADWVSTNASALADDETGWAQELSMYLKAGIAVANYADSGETSGSFYSKFFPAARDAMKAGDYLLIQFGHNNKSAADIARYGADLQEYIDDARAKGVTPVIVSPVSRLSATAANPGFNGLDQVARDVAAREGVALVDLSVLSREFYASAPNRSALFIDGTHFHEVGAIGVAGVVADALKASSLDLRSFVK